MKVLIAYVLMLALVPTLTGIVSLLSMFVTVPLALMLKIHADYGIRRVVVYRFILAALEGLLAVWLTVKIFHWFDSTPTVLTFVILAGWFMQNDYRRAKREEAPLRKIRTGEVMGDCGGVILGALLVL